MVRSNLLPPILAAAVLASCSIAGYAQDNGSSQRAPTEATELVRTGKERLGGKASDEQRVDNCNVPPGSRGPKIRPDECRHDARAPPTK